jgi:hypothetical protein
VNRGAADLHALDELRDRAARACADSQALRDKRASLRRRVRACRRTTPAASGLADRHARALDL